MGQTNHQKPGIQTRTQGRPREFCAKEGKGGKKASAQEELRLILPRGEQFGRKKSRLPGCSQKEV